MPTYEVKFDTPSPIAGTDVIVRLNDGSEVIGHIVKRSDDEVEGHGRVMPLPEGGFTDASLLGRDQKEDEVEGHGPLDIGPRT